MLSKKTFNFTISLLGCSQWDNNFWTHTIICFYSIWRFSQNIATPKYFLSVH